MAWCQMTGDLPPVWMTLLAAEASVAAGSNVSAACAGTGTQAGIESTVAEAWTRTGAGGEQTVADAGTGTGAEADVMMLFILL